MIGKIVKTVVRECHQDHKDDRKDRENGHPQDRQRQQRFVELFIHQRLKIVFRALQFVAGLQDLFTDLVLLNIGIPGINKCYDEEDRQNTVKQNEERVIAVDCAASFLVRFYGTQRGEFSEIIKPGLRRVRIEHIKVKERLENEEENPPSPLPSCTGPKSHNKV